MLKEYLIVAQEALNAKKEIYQIKQQRFELAQEEYQPTQFGMKVQRRTNPPFLCLLML